MQPIDDQSPQEPDQEQRKADQPLSEETRPAEAGNQGWESRPANSPVPGGQFPTYGSPSEQIPFPYLPAREAYRQEPTGPVPSGMYSPPAAPSRPAWSYPPRPEHYQGGSFGPQGSRVTRPIDEPTPGQFGQPALDPIGGYSRPYEAAPGYGSLYSARNSPFAQRSQPLGLNSQPLGLSNQPESVVAPQERPRRSGLRTGAIIALVILVALVFGSGIFSGWELAHNGNTGNLSGNSGPLQPGKASTVVVPALNGSNEDAVREAVIGKVQPGVVEINVSTPSENALGSGVIIDGRGYIVTNNHVVTGATSIEVTLADGTNLTAQVAGVDAADDLAVVKVTPPGGGLSVVSLGDSSKLVVGQAVLAVGNPLGNANTVTSGIVSALARNVSEGQNQPTLPDAIQTDAPINPGNSGGALVDLQGNLVGIPTLNAIDTEFNTPAEGLGFAIPSNRVQYVTQQIIANGRVLHTGRAVMGVEVTNVDQSVASQFGLSVTSGALVVAVTSGGAAASAGLQAHDVIVQVGTSSISSITDLSTALLQKSPGQAVAVKIYRGSQQKTINVTLGELSAN